MKFSIIIPVYNVEKYLEKCLNSVVIQEYKNYEVIIVCDKCNDNSELIVDKYVKKYKNFIKIYAEKTGLSKAKNIGIANSNGDYLMFLDSDDYLEKDCLKRLSKEIELDLEMLRFQAQDIYENETVKHNEDIFNTTNGIVAFNKILKYHYIEPSWCYIYKKEFWDKYNFHFMENCIAEDFGLTPLIIAKAKKIKSINYIGYNYVHRKDSIMSNQDYNKKLKKMDDMFKQAEFMFLELEKIKNNDNFIAFINNSLIYYSTTLKYKDFKKYNKKLQEKNCFEHLKGNKLKNKIKNFIIKKNAYVYYKFLVR